jgi:tetratricopeptide (TPR) repeat protein
MIPPPSADHGTPELKALLEVVDAHPPPPQACEALADQLMGLGYAAQAARWRTWSLLPPEAPRLREAIAELRQRWGLEPVRSLSAGRLDADLVLSQAQQLLEQGDLPNARRALQRVARQRGFPPGLCNRVGMLEEQLGEFPSAERWYRASLQQVPSQHLVWFPLAKVLLWQQAWDEALAAAEQGLRLSPNHPWGLKLRLQALQALGAVQTLSVLADLGGLPEGQEGQGFQEAAAVRRRRQMRRPAPPPDGLPMVDRLRLRRLLAERPPLWLSLFGRTAGPLALAREAGLLPDHLQLQPMASRDPLALRQSLADYPLQLLDETPAAALHRLTEVGLIVIHRGQRRSLPVGLARLLREGVPVVSPAGWLAPSGTHAPLIGHCGWQLWWPHDPSTG